MTDIELLRNIKTRYLEYVNSLPQNTTFKHKCEEQIISAFKKYELNYISFHECVLQIVGTISIVSNFFQHNDIN